MIYSIRNITSHVYTYTSAYISFSKVVYCMYCTSFQFRAKYSADTEYFRISLQ